MPSEPHYFYFKIHKGANGGSGGGTGGAESEEQTMTAGLYQTGTDTLLTSWDDLLDQGIVHVENGVVYTNVDMETEENSSSDALAGDLVLPDDGTITAIGDFDEDSGTGKPAFYGCTSLTSITIPNSVTSIGNFAFYGCSSLASITIPDSVTTIRSSTFSGCTGLTSITIPDSVTTIGEYAFFISTNLTSITFEGTVEQWNAMTKGYMWNYNVPATEVVCSDGTVSLS